MLFAENAAGVWVLYGVLVVVGATALAFVFGVLQFCNSLMKALQACTREYRTAEPLLVWLNLVPVLNLFWQFWTVQQVSNSLVRAYRARRLPTTDPEFGRWLGMTLCSVGVVGFVFIFTANPMISGTKNEAALLAVTGLELLLTGSWIALWLMYWIKVVRYTRRLREAEAEWEYAADGP
jgi:hypothetical protein